MSLDPRDGALDPAPDGVAADCGHCGRGFTVPQSKAGSYVNCPHCGKAVQVAGGRDLLWWVILALAGIVLLAAGGMVWTRAGPPAGLAVFFAGLAGGWLLSRAL